MHSFHHSRGRILFEVLCAFGISASCVEAWVQTYAPAFLPVAAIAGLYGLVHLFDMARRSPPVAASVEAAAPVSDDRGDLLVYLEAVEPELQLDAEPQVADDAQPEVAEPVQDVQPEVVEAVQESEPEVVESPQQPEPVADLVPEAEPEAAEPIQVEEPAQAAHDEPEYSPVAPLFEAEPFVRKQRAAFGRKAG